MAVSSTIDNGDGRVITITGTAAQSVTLQPAIGVEVIRVANSATATATVRVMPGKKLNGTKNGTVSVPAGESRTFKGNAGGWTMLENSASLDGDFAPRLTPGTTRTTAVAAVAGAVNRYDATAGALAPAAPAVGIAGSVYEAQKTDSSSNAVTIGGETLSGQGDAVRFISDGTNWISGGVRTTRTQQGLTFGRLWSFPAASTTLTGTLVAWTIIAVDCTAGAGARTLPAASSVAAGTAFAAKKADTSTNALVVGVTGGDKIYGTGTGATSKTLILPGEAVEFVSDGVGSYEVRASDTPSSQLETRYAPLPTARPGNVAVFLGDSITIGSDAATVHGECWPLYACIMSGQRIQYGRNAGVAGNTSAQMLARFDTDVTPYAPSLVNVAAGTNDTGQSVSLATFSANIIAIVAKIRAIRAVPVLCTMPPNTTDSPLSRRRSIIQFNAWLRNYAAAQGITLVDMYGLLADPANAGWLAAYPSGDGTHPGTAGAAAMGALYSSIVAPLLPNITPHLCGDDVDEINAITKGCFTAGSGSTLSTGWSDNAGVPSGSVLSYTTDAAVPGQMMTITSTATAAIRQPSFGVTIGSDTITASAGATTISFPTLNPGRAVLFIGSGATAEIAKVTSVSGSGPWTATLTRALINAHTAETVVVNALPGDTMLTTGRITNDAGGISVQVKCNFLPSGSVFPMSNIPRQITRGVWYQRFVVAAGTTAIQMQPLCGAGTGVTSFGQIGLYNADRLGI